jgi:site-specific DNA-methyltransferase (adenine-specific)
MTGKLFYGDNLDILRNSIADESVDLVYLDPPFNSNASYNVLFKAPDGHESHAQMEAFDDTWHWTDVAERAFDEVMHSGNTDAAEMLRAMRSFLKENDMMAYLAMMAVRLIELHRVLKKTGSLYLHCDPTASHYLKILMDAIFGPTNFGNEIVWKRQNSKGLAFTRFARNHDIILRYTKSDKWIWNAQYTEHDPEYVRQFYKYTDENGRTYRLADLTNPNKNRPNLTYEFLGVTRVWRWTRERMQKAYEDGLVVQNKPGQVPALKRYLDEQEGNPVDDIWSDVAPVQAQAQERLGYPTQKPLSLLERIINASSNEGDVVLDPFCGCGTTVHAAQKLNRNWIGIDVTHLAISLIQKRLRDAFGPSIAIEVNGVPKDIGGAEALAEADKYQFQWWAVSLVDAIPFGDRKKGADGGIDGLIYFKPDGKATEKAIVSVKGGKSVGVTMVKDLIATVEREKAKMGIFITLAPPTGPMIKEAASAGFYKTEYGSYPKIQILTIEQLFEGHRPHMPWIDPSVFKKAKKEDTSKQHKLL